MLACPIDLPVSNPVLLTVAIKVGLVDQMQLEVRFWVELSIKVAVTVSCSVAPLLRLKIGLSGVSFSPLAIRAGAVTVRSVFPVIPFRVALIDVVPAATVVATPPVAIVAILGWDDAQVTVLVMSGVVPSE